MAANENKKTNVLLTEPRFLLAIKARWFIISLLLLFALIAALSNSDYYALKDLVNFLTVPAVLLMLCAAFNGFLHYSWYSWPTFWSSNLKKISIIQIMIDIVVATALIHFTGGVGSWFWTLYVLIALELTYLLPNLQEILIIGFIGSTCYTLTLAAEYYGLIEVGRMPYMSTNLTHSLPYIAIIWSWVHLLNITIALVSLDFQRKRIAAAQAREIRDELTGAYNINYFNQALGNEIQRAKRYQRPVSLLLIDIDNFHKYRVDKSEAEANEIIIRLANTLASNVRRQRGDSAYDVDILCRFGTDRFCIVLPETTAEAESAGKDTKPAGAVILAKRLMGKVAENITSETGVTICIGIAGFPYHALETEQLIKAVDDATQKAKKLGKHRIMVATPLVNTSKAPVH
ncbi:MAG: diguanylate cyclase [Actinobacteria bacterium]|nr:MAG: diguanylate cyclase [Actinomycetota bacterium]